MSLGLEIATYCEISKLFTVIKCRVVISFVLLKFSLVRVTKTMGSRFFETS